MEQFHISVTTTLKDLLQMGLDKVTLDAATEAWVIKMESSGQLVDPGFKAQHLERLSGLYAEGKPQSEKFVTTLQEILRANEG